MPLTKVSYSMIQGAPINPFDFGTAGNGTTDDTAAFQAAINYAISNGYGMIDGEGYTYAISAPLTFTAVNNFTLANCNFVAIGASWTSTEYLLDFSDTTANAYDFNRNTVTNININAKNLCSGIHIKNGQTCLFEACKIIHYHANGIGFYQSGNSADIRIDNSYIGGHYYGSPDNGGGGTTAYYNGTAVKFDGPDNKITDTTLVGDNVPLTYTRYMTNTYPKTVQTTLGGITIDACHSYNGLMLIDGQQQTITNCYFGWNSIRLLYPYSLVINNNRFVRENLAGYVNTNDWMIAIEPPAPNATWYLSSVSIVGNSFGSAYAGTMRPIQRWGTVGISKVQECAFDNSYNGNCLVTKLTATKRYTASGSTSSHTFDFSDVIIFGTPASYQVSFGAASAGTASAYLSGSPAINAMTVGLTTAVTNADYVCTLSVNEPY